MFCLRSLLATPHIFVDEIIGEAIKGHMQSQSQCRMFSFQHSSSSLSVQQAQQKAQYLYTVDANESYIMYLIKQFCHHRRMLPLLLSVMTSLLQCC